LTDEERPYRVPAKDLARLVSGKGLSRRRRQEKLARKVGDVRQKAPDRARSMRARRDDPWSGNAPVRMAGGRGSLPGAAANRVESLEFSRRSRETTVSKGTVLPKVAGVNFTGESLTAIMAHSRAVELARRRARSIYVG
jgi:hypothetical protein